MQSFPNLNGKKEIDMNLPNYENKISAEAQLPKPLQNLIETMYVVRPTLKFVASDRQPYQINPLTIGTVVVYEDGIYLGKVKLSYEDYREKGRTNVFYLFSDNIVKKRGERQQTKTLNINKAVKIIQDVFSAPGEEKVWSDMTCTLANEIEDVVRHAKWAASSIIDRSRTPLAAYLLDVYENGPKQMPDNLVALMFKKDNEIQSFRDLKIVSGIEDHHKLKNGVAIALFEDGKVWSVSLTEKDKGISRLQSTYDLPINYQEKLSMLRILEPRQPVENMGVYFETTVQLRKCKLFFLIAGDTVFTC